MTKINIKTMTDSTLEYIKRNIEYVTNQIIKNETNEWIYSEFSEPIFNKKIFEIDDFELKDNPNQENKDIDFENSIVVYNALKDLPRYILIDEKFWLWLHFEKFYTVVRRMMKINSESTIQNMWMHSQGVRRGLMFGVLSRCYFRVALTIDENNENPYELTKWIIDNPLRFRELTWRTYSSEEHIVRGALKGEKQAVEELGYERNSAYALIAKYISRIGSTKLLDILDEDEIKELVLKKTKEFMRNTD